LQENKVVFPIFPACNTLDQSCRCDDQGDKACQRIPHTICNSESQACECDAMLYRIEGGQCIPAFSYTSDGSELTPFIHSPISSVLFTPAVGNDVTAYGIPSNNQYLYAIGMVRQLLILTERFDIAFVL